MRILGVDPGSIRCGYGFIDAGSSSSGAVSYVASGVIDLDRRKPLPERLRELYLVLRDTTGEHNPEVMAVEKIFFARGATAAIQLGQARGVVLLVASLLNIPVYEYSALEVKKSVVGYGRADKGQMQMMMRAILSIPHSLLPDSADALAVAFCHAGMQRFADAVRSAQS